MERLDRGLGNGDWRSLFTRTTVRHLPRHASDHAPLLLDTMGDTDRCPRPFRFEAIWAQDKRSDEIINKAWHFHGSGSPFYVLCQHLKATYEVGTEPCLEMLWNGCPVYNESWMRYSSKLVSASGSSTTGRTIMAHKVP